MKEYSLTNHRSGKRLDFPSFLDLIEYLQHAEEIDGWILHVHHT